MIARIASDLAILQIRMMLEVGFPNDEIAAYFGVTEKDIEEVIKELENYD